MYKEELVLMGECGKLSISQKPETSKQQGF